MPNATPSLNPNYYSKKWCCYYPNPDFFSQTNNMFNLSQKGGGKTTLKLEFLI